METEPEDRRSIIVVCYCTCHQPVPFRLLSAISHCCPFEMIISALATRLGRRRLFHAARFPQPRTSRGPSAALLGYRSAAAPGTVGLRENSFSAPLGSVRGFSLAVPTGSSDAERVADATKKAKELSDYKINPQGSYTVLQFQEAKEILDVFIETGATNPETVASSIDVLMRLAKEMSISKESEEELPDFFCYPAYYRPLIHNWGTVAREGQQHEHVTLARDLFLKLTTMSRLLPDFFYDAETVAIIMDAAIKEAKAKRAAVVGEELLELIIKEVTRFNLSELQSYVIIYNQVLQAWADCGALTAPVRMDTLMKNMRKAGVVPDAETYTLFLKYWGTRSIVHRIEELLKEMKKEGVKLSVPMLAQLVDGYSRSGKTEKANDLLGEILDRNSSDEEEVTMVGKCIHNMLLAHQAIMRSKVPFERKERALALAEGLLQRSKTYDGLSQELRSKHLYDCNYGS